MQTTTKKKKEVPIELTFLHDGYLEIRGDTTEAKTALVDSLYSDLMTWLDLVEALSSNPNAGDPYVNFIDLVNSTFFGTEKLDGTLERTFKWAISRMVILLNGRLILEPMSSKKIRIAPPLMPANVTHGSRAIPLDAILEECCPGVPKIAVFKLLEADFPAGIRREGILHFPDRRQRRVPEPRLPVLVHALRDFLEHALRQVVSAASRSTELPHDPVLSGAGVPWQEAQCAS